MRVMRNFGKGATALVVFLLLAGCETTQPTTEAAVTQGDIAALRGEIADLRAELGTVRQQSMDAAARAEAAEQAAQRAAADARAAAEKADRIYVKSLQK